MSQALVAALNSSGLGLSAKDLGNGEIHLGSLPGTIVDQSQPSNLTVTGQAFSVEDGDTFTLSDGTTDITFEFDRIGGVTGSNIPVLFNASMTASEIARCNCQFDQCDQHRFGGEYI